MIRIIKPLLDLLPNREFEVQDAEFKNFVLAEVAEHIKDFKEDKIEDFMAAYIEESRLKGDDKESTVEREFFYRLKKLKLLIC